MFFKFLERFPGSIPETGEEGEKEREGKSETIEGKENGREGMEKKPIEMGMNGGSAIFHIPKLCFIQSSPVVSSFLN